ncbi:hypothetical protein EVAR_75577_1 [Eumeta japonica]|uniref:DUF5641 domain-containing protein n=1 Tax=Eumeta variegata TaxID=151549 RepID=A0A4C1TFQ0_EUMVA|nr:hypothetical protein EVAR_75577_1 [Eumeta japonica]
MILALRRFIARRGTPRVMYSDNGTNFVGANKELMNIQEVHEKMKKEADVRTITGSSYLPALEHGWRLGAPLTEVDVEPAEAEGLTPNHFLIGRSCGAAAAGHFDDNVLLGPANWRTCQRLADHFWQRWLRNTYRLWCPPARGDPICRAPAEGDIVLIVDSSSPRYSWPRGRIKKTYPVLTTRFVWWTSRRLVAFCGVPLRRSSCWCQLRRRLFRVLKCSAAHRGENVTDSRAINVNLKLYYVLYGLKV